MAVPGARYTDDVGGSGHTHDRKDRPNTTERQAGGDREATQNGVGPRWLDGEEQNT